MIRILVISLILTTLNAYEGYVCGSVIVENEKLETETRLYVSSERKEEKTFISFEKLRESKAIFKYIGECKK